MRDENGNAWPILNLYHLTPYHLPAERYHALDMERRTGAHN